MTTTTTTPPVTSVVLRPRYDGANIRSWIGFKQFMQLAEEAVLAWLREHTPGARRLYLEHGLGVEILDSSVQLPAVLEVDDQVHATVTWLGPGRFAVALEVERDGRRLPVLRGKLTLALVREVDPPATRPLTGVAGAGLLGEPVAAPAGTDPGWGGPDTGWPWSWWAGYYRCHFSDRVQHSAYVRALEEVVAAFLAARGISVARLLRERGWIPVVSRARVRLLEAARMEEEVHTTFAVTDILRQTMFDGRMDCFVRRGDGVVHVATARILHGYALSRGPEAGSLATLDAGVVAALTGTGADPVPTGGGRP